MRTQLFAIFFVFVYFQSFAQKRGDNIIIIKNVSYETACKTLLSEGFVIDKRDAELQTVKTEPKMTKGNWLTTIIVYVRVVDSTVRINTTFTLEGTILKDEELGYPANKKGKFYPSSATGQAWVAVEALARKMGSEIEYLKE